MKKKSTLAWIWDFVSLHKIYFVLSLIFAFASVLSGFLPYFFIGGMINQLLAGNKNWDFYLLQSAWAGLAWIGYWGFHGISTMLSHKATFKILAEMRHRLTDKMARLPLGTVLSQSSGSYKNIIVERVDATETTLAHLIPEFTAGIFGPIIVLIAMLVIDWRLTLLSLLRIVDLSVDMVNQVLAIQPMDISGQDIEPKSSRIELRDVSFSYGNKKIIDRVSLTIPEKTTTALVGPSGSGKTTLCNLIARFWDVDQGSISLDGHDVREYSYDSLIRNFSFVFQSVYLFEDTIANNIRFGKPEASQEEVIEAAKKASCHDFILSLPDGYDTKIGEGGASLSGGERQRISIARAIIKDAPIIILDEATANVDPENEEALMQAIQALTRDKTIIMIAHRLKTVEHADQILVLDQGRIVEQGKHQDLLAKQGIYSKFIQERKTAASWRIEMEE